MMFINKKKITIFLITFCYSIISFSQSTKQNFRKIDELIEASTELKEAESLLKKIEYSNFEEELIPEINIRKMLICKAKENYEESITHGLLALKGFENQKNKSKIGKCYIELIESYNKTGKFKEAFESFFNAEKILTYNDRAELYTNIASVYSNIKDFKSSINYLIKADAIATKSRNEKVLMKIYYTIGFLNTIQNNEKEAIEYYYKSLKISKKLKNYSFITKSNNNIGTIYVAKNDTKKALEIFLENKKNSDFLDQSSSIVADLNFNIASSYIYLNKTESAFKYLELVKNHTKINTNSRLAYYLLVIYSDIYKDQKQYELAISKLNEALVLSKKNQNNEITSLIYSKLSNIFYTKKDYKNAYDFQLKYTKTNAIVSQNAKENDTKELQLKYEIDNYENNIKTQKQEIELLKYKSSQSKYQYAILILLILGLAFFVIRQNNIIKIKKRNEKYLEEINQLKEENYNNEVTFKNKQVTEFALQIQEQNNLLLLLKKNLGTIKNITKETSVLDEVQKTQMMINDTIVLNNEKVQLNSEVEDTQKSFLFKLKSNFPDLNEKEIQITTLLRLNFNTKQIATQLGIAEHSIHNYRYSIRKKLELDKDENLVDFLKNL